VLVLKVVCFVGLLVVAGRDGVLLLSVLREAQLLVAEVVGAVDGLLLLLLAGDTGAAAMLLVVVGTTWLLVVPTAIAAALLLLGLLGLLGLLVVVVGNAGLLLAVGDGGALELVAAGATGLILVVLVCTTEVALVVAGAGALLLVEVGSTGLVSAGVLVLRSADWLDEVCAGALLPGVVCAGWLLAVARAVGALVVTVVTAASWSRRSSRR
jgi:hypothetical protein